MSVPALGAVSRLCDRQETMLLKQETMDICECTLYAMIASFLNRCMLHYASGEWQLSGLSLLPPSKKHKLPPLNATRKKEQRHGAFFLALECNLPEQQNPPTESLLPAWAGALPGRTTCCLPPPPPPRPLPPERHVASLPCPASWTGRRMAQLLVISRGLAERGGRNNG